MSSACAGSQYPQAQQIFNYEGRLSVSVAPSSTSTSSNSAAAANAIGTTSKGDSHQMDYDQAVVLRRIKAECDMLTDYHNSHPKDFGMDSMMPSVVYSSPAPFSPPSAFTAPPVQAAGNSHAVGGALLPSTPQSGSNFRQQHVQDDSGISPGSTGSAAPAANSGDDESMKKQRNANSESGNEDHAVGSGASASPFSDRCYSGDGHLDEDDDDLMDEHDEDDELLDDASREAGSDVVGDALSRLERALNGQTADNGSSGNSQTVYQCTMCSYSATSRFHFQAHLNSHFDVKCSHCDFTARTEGKLRAHMRNAHAEALGLEEGEISGSKVPRVNSQGKLKTHKCKHPQCGFVAVTKLDFWEHSRTHIKAEKLLTCPHCPFVTEYKHHLEYHTRNHLNSKPFKCPKCSYSCVNKSMLNSHMKSHSNVYQFRCRDCAYATKYQHSLKLHLRKYGHTCTTALSDANDGEVQPTKTKGRRGPKKTKADKTDKATVNNTVQASSGPVTPPTGVFHQAPAGVGSSPALPNPFGFPLYPGHPLLMNVPELEKKKARLNEDNLKCTLCDYVTTSREHFSQHLIAHAAADQQQLASLFGAFPTDLLNSSANQTPLKGAGSIGLASSTPQMKDYLSRMLANPTLLFGTPPVVQQQQQQLITKNSAEMSRSPTPEPAPPQVKPNQTPLDLSREKDDVPAVNGSAKQHRRKGQAFKLERSTPTIASPAGSPIQRRPSPAHTGTPSPSMIEPTVDEEEDDGLDTSLEKPIPRKEAKKRQAPAEWGGAYQCPYCDIAFKDVVMYTMHMGYHGYQDPFTCNMCGQSTHDKLAFFLHIARSSHS